MTLEKTTRMNYLYDFYQSLLTNKQQSYMALYYLDDFSLGEIAEEYEVSRQAVYDNIKRTEAMLEEYEAKLLLFEKFQQRSALLQKLKEEELSSEQMREFEKVIVLRAVDSKWMDHIDTMDQLRQGIHLRAYAQINPLNEYQQEGFAMFEAMISAIEDDVAKYIMKAEIRNNLEREEVVKGQAVNPKGDEGETVKKKPKRNEESVGRNAPCPCGSGKKYKNCHGR